VVFRNFPLDSGCNRKMERPMHPYACEAAKYVQCANQQGKFEAVYEAFFQNQASFAPGKLSELAAGTGADTAKLTQCMNAPETAIALSRDIEEGIVLGIQSTPTFFINGHKYEGVLPPEAWKKLIEKLSAQPVKP
jgi:protein-disulfide isomerase